MIIRFVKMSGVEMTLACEGVLTQPVTNMGVDVEVMTSSGNKRFLLRETPISDEWQRAYIMENGRTVDTIRPSVPPKP